MRLDAGQHLVELPGGADEGPVMLDGVGALELHQAGAGDAVQSLAGRIRDEMDVQLRRRCGVGHLDTHALRGISTADRLISGR
jgi:hypothetical protein